METALSMREATAVVMLRRIAEHCSMIGQASVSFQSHLAKVSPDTRHAYSAGLAALIECRLLGTEGSDLFLSQYGQAFLEFGDASAERRELPLTQEQKLLALARIRNLLSFDARLDPQKIDGSITGTSRPGNPQEFWIGATITVAIIVLFLYQVLILSQVVKR